MSDTDAPGLGHNNPPEPTREERHATIVTDVETIAAKGNALPVTIPDDTKLGELVEVVKAAKKLRDRVDTTRKDENRPHDDEIKANNAFFNALFARLKRMGDVLEGRAGDYNNAKQEAERQRLAAEAAKRQAEHDAEMARQAAAAPKDGIEAEMEADRLERLRNEQAAAEARVFQSTGPTQTSAGSVGQRKSLDFRVKDYAALDLSEFRDSFTVEMIDKAIRDHVRKHKKTKPLKGVEIFETSKTNIR